MLVGNPEKCDYGGNKRKLCDEKICLCCYKRSFMSHSKVECWSEKNDKKPRQVFKSSGKKYWFKCDCGHEFDSILSNITKGQWCPYCCYPSQKLCDKDECISCHSKSFASHSKAKYWSDKNEETPRQVFMSSGNKYWFDCKCEHEFSILLNSINNECWCPYCANKKLCDKDDCEQCHSKSFASHPMSEFWSEENERTPRQVFKSSNNKYWFNCDCDHGFTSALNHINGGRWCPYCANKKLCNEDECMSCYSKSFASHSKAKYWSKENKEIPRQVFKSSNKKYWFNCDCGHGFTSALGSITNGQWCPYCANQKLCDEDDCEQCYSKSFASNPMSEFWSEENKGIIQRQVFMSSGNKYWFDCVCGHEFEARLSAISRGNWCPICKNKTEKKLYKFLTDLSSKWEYQGIFDWCKSSKNRHLPFDFYNDSIKVIIELDGRQHFEQVRNWNSPEVTQATDRDKLTKAKNNRYSMIRILQEDVWNDKNNWKEKLQEELNNFPCDEPRLIFIGDYPEEYKNFVSMN